MVFLVQFVHCRGRSLQGCSSPPTILGVLKKLATAALLILSPHFDFIDQRVETHLRQWLLRVTMGADG